MNSINEWVAPVARTVLAVGKKALPYLKIGGKKVGGAALGAGGFVAGDHVVSKALGKESMSDVVGDMMSKDGITPVPTASVVPEPASPPASPPVTSSITPTNIGLGAASLAAAGGLGYLAYKNRKKKQKELENV